MQPPVHLTKEDYFSDSDFHLKGHCCKEKGIPNGKNLTYINHYHAFSELVLILGGNAIQNINGKDYHVERGDLFLLEGNTAHFFRSGTEFSLFNVLFDKETLPLPWSLYRQSNGYNLFFEVEPKARTPRSFKNRLKLKNEDTDFVFEKLSLITHKLSQARKTQDILLKTEALSCFGECIIFISRLFETYENSQETVISGVSRVIAMLEEHFAEEFSLETMAKKACTSPRNFSRQFIKVTGVPPGEYLHRLRMTKASQYLKEEIYSIDTVARKCGFHDSSYFSKCFSRFFGLSARDYRKNLKETTPRLN